MPNLHRLAFASPTMHRNHPHKLHTIISKLSELLKKGYGYCIPISALQLTPQQQHNITHRIPLSEHEAAIINRRIHRIFQEIQNGRFELQERHITFCHSQLELYFWCTPSEGITGPAAAGKPLKVFRMNTLLEKISKLPHFFSRSQHHTSHHPSSEGVVEEYRINDTIFIIIGLICVFSLILMPFGLPTLMHLFD